jgi:oligopeptidase B
MKLTRILHSACLLIGLMTHSALMAQIASPPVAAIKPYQVTSPNGARTDNYYWLRDDKREAPEMLAYLSTENTWYEQYAQRYKPLEEKLFGEIRGRIKQDDSSVPYKQRDYFYYTRFDEGKEYPIYARKRGSLDAAEEVMLDVNELAKLHNYYQVGATAISSGQDIVAYAEDTTGRRQYVLRFKNLKTGEIYADAITGSASSMAWANDNKTLFYVENDPITLRSFRVKRHVLGTTVASDVVVYEEKDESFYTEVSKTDSERYISIQVGSTISDEQRILPADRPNEAFKLFAPRQPDFHYSADHIDGRWIIRTDWNAPNYKAMQVAEAQIGDRKQWQTLIAHDRQVFINGFALFKRYLVIDERSDGLRRLSVQPWQDGKLKGKPTHIRSDEPAYTASLSTNVDQNTDTLRYSYSSLTTPTSIFDVNMKTGERKLMKRQPVLGGFDSANYRTERLWVKARDGVKVPVSLVYRKEFQRNGAAPLFQYGYGSYGASSDPIFRSNILSLLDRGFVYAIAHIRGGQEMGRAWYENGKKLHKQNTFNDFVDVTQALVAQKYAAPDKVFAQGGSAGGLLMGAVVNMRPDLYRGVLADVPFVDAVTTMLDESIPLTTNEFDEWGNPKQKEFYDYMMKYSPYDNVKPQAYPAMLVTTGLYDSQVQYYEPAKWVAKLRAMKKDDKPLLFKINMEAGHGGKSGRFTRLKEVAQGYAFVLDLLGINQ